MASSSSTTRTSLSKRQDFYLCVVLVYHDRGDHLYSLHMIKLTDLFSGTLRHTPSPLELPPPVLDLPPFLPPHFFAYDMDFFSYGTKIYMFGGTLSYLGGGDELDGDGKYRNQPCYVFETCSRKPHYNVVREIDPPNYGKVDAVIMGPIHGKFYILSNRLFCKDFEEFDPLIECWLTLPQPPIEGLSRDSHDCVAWHCVCGDLLIPSSTNSTTPRRNSTSIKECMAQGSAIIESKRI